MRLTTGCASAPRLVVTNSPDNGSSSFHQLLVVRAQLRQDVRLLCRQVGRPAPGRWSYVIKLLAVDQPPLVPDDGGFPLLQPGAAVLDNQLAVGKLALAAEQSGEAQAIEPGRGGRFHAAQLKQRREEVLNLRRRGKVPRLAQPAGRPAYPARHPVAAVVEGGLAVAQPGVPHLHARRAAVVGHEDEDGVVAQPGVAQERFEPLHVLVNVGNHAEEPGRAFALVAVFLGRIERERSHRARCISWAHQAGYAGALSGR